MTFQIQLEAKSKVLSNPIRAWLESKNTVEVKDGVILLNKQQSYADNFGLQWNTFQLTQFDSYSNLPLTENRLCECSEWNLERLKGRNVLEIGSGAGRFTEIFLKYGANVVSVDLSDAVFANASNNPSNKALFIRASFEELEGLENIFDYVFCYGVSQHTPNPKEVYRFCCAMAKKGGFISVDQYRKTPHPSPFYFPKYFWRPVTKRIKPSILLKIVRWYIPYYIIFDTLLIRAIPSRRLSGLIRGCIPIPCWNYFGIPNINQERENLIEWAVMDTFDALGAKYDFPASVKEIKSFGKTLNVSSFKVKGGGNGVIFNAVK